LLLRRLVAEGFSGGPVALEVADRVERCPDVERIAEACALASAALDRSRLLGAARRLGWVGAATEVGGDAQDPDLGGLSAAGVGRVVERGQRTVTVELQFGLDPTLFGRFREAAIREPRLAQALATDAPLTVKLGWFLARDHTSASPSVLALRLGEVAFETSGKDRPAFLTELLPELGRRLRVGDPFEDPADLAARLLRASLAPEARQRSGWASVRALAAAPPFSLPTPELVSVDGRVDLAFGPELRSWRRLGRPAVDAVRWLADAYVEQPDVLIVAEHVPEEVLQFWTAALDASGAPVEQVVCG
jgi:hypothetical protein